MEIFLINVINVRIINYISGWGWSGSGRFLLLPPFALAVVLFVEGLLPIDLWAGKSIPYNIEYLLQSNGI